MLLISACSNLKIGNVGAVKEANELAISCKTDEALMAVDRATQGGGFGASIGDLQRVVILRDAGRMEEADAAFLERNKRWHADAKNIADAEKAIADSIEEIRAERQKRTGHHICDWFRNQCALWKNDSEAASEEEAIVDYVFWRGVVLVVLLILGIGLLRLLPQNYIGKKNLKSNEWAGLQATSSLPLTDSIISKNLNEKLSFLAISRG